MKIEDGKGSGLLAEVDDENRLRVFAVTEPEDKHTNREGFVWSFHQSTTAAGVGDYVWYFKNTGTEDLAISDLRATVGGATTLYFDKVTGTASGGSTLTPVTRNLGSSKTPEATTQEGTDITGLTAGGVLYFQRCATANTQYHLSMSANIMIPQGQSVGLRSSAAVAVETLISVVSLAT